MDPALGYKPPMWRPSLDPFTLALVATVALASVAPVQGEAAEWLKTGTGLAIAVLFFMHGAKLSRADLLAGAGHWRLHGLVLLVTFLLFPLLGLAIRSGLEPALGPILAAGFLFLCVLPSTIQSSIAFTAIAGGNVPAAVCAASASNLIGIFLTPVLVGLTLGIDAKGGSLGAVEAIIVQLLVPFLAGHASRPWTGAFVDKHRAMLGRIDRGTILLVVYGAFSAAVIEGIWTRLAPLELAATVLVSGALLGIALIVTWAVARAMGFERRDEIVLLFCGSKKSLASGVPMAGVLFPAATVGTLVLPLMVFHQVQLMVCAVLARRYAAAARPAGA